MKKLKIIKQTPEYSVYSHQSKSGGLSCLMQLMLIYLAVLATVLCVSTSLAMTVPLVEIILICLLATAFFAGALYNKITTAVFAGVTLISLPLMWNALQSFFETFYKGVLFCYDLAFVIMKMRGWNYTGNMLTSEQEITVLLEDELLVTSYFRSVIVVLAIFYAFWFVACSWKRPRIWPTITVSLAVMVPGFMIGLVPSSVAFSLLLAVAFGLYIQTLPSRRLQHTTFKQWLKNLVAKQASADRFAYTRKSGLYGICTAGVSWVLMLLIALVTVRTPLIELDEIRRYLDDGSRYIYNQVFYSRLETPENAIGNMLEGDTMEILDIPNIHKVPVLYVKSNKNTDIYLRAWVTDSLNQKGWQVVDERDDADYQRTVVKGTNPYGFAYQLHKVFVDERLSLESQQSYGFEMDTLEIRARFKKSLVAHLPSYGGATLADSLASANITAGEVIYFENKRPSGNTYITEAFLPVITSKGYARALHGLADQYRTLLTMDTSDIESENFQNFKAQERSYYEYVKKHYLNAAALPVSFQNKALDLTRECESQLTKVLAIEKYFRNNAEFTYTLEPEQLQDATVMQQLEYSLNTKKEGYCTYYATAMTLMVRSLGYPARLVEGYYLQSTDDEPDSNGQYRRVVMDDDCHAWVEVYFAGLGWMNFDPTPNREETLQEYTQRYYAIELESAGGEGEEKEGSGQPKVQVIDVAEQPQDDEIMPALTIEYGIFGGMGLLILVLGILALLLLLLAIVTGLLYWKANRHAADRYKGFKAPDENGEEAGQVLKVQRMHRLILRWLQLKKLKRHTEETELAYARRIDQTLQTENSFAELLPILQKCEFGKGKIVDTQYRKVEAYYTELYYKLHHQKGRLPWWQKLKI